jgi:hypothetical protein
MRTVVDKSAMEFSAVAKRRAVAAMARAANHEPTEAERALRSRISLNVTWTAICLIGGIAFLAVGNLGWGCFGIGLTVIGLVSIYFDVAKLGKLEEARMDSRDGFE